MEASLQSESPESPPRARELPWAGSGLAFTRRPLTFLRRAHETLGSDIVRFGYFGKTLYSVQGKAATELFFSSPRLDLMGGFVEVFGGLVPKRFIPQHDAGLYAFSKQRAVFNMHGYLDAVRVSADEVLRELGREGEIDIFDLTSTLSFRASSRFMLGEPIMSPGFFLRWRELFFATSPLESLGKFQWNLLNPLFWRRQNQLFGDLEQLLSTLIDAKDPIPPGEETSYLDLGLNGIYRERPRAQVVGHVYMMFLAAFLNPSLSLGWCLCDLLEPHNRYRDRVLAEIGTRPIDYDELPTLQLCLMETLRMRISAVNIRKVLGEPLVIGGYTIPVGAVVCNSPTFAHMSAANFDRPGEYLPERWLGTPELERSTMTSRYMPFGTLAHICPGKRFSHTWLKMVIAELLDRYELTLIGRAPRVREGIMPVLGDRDGPCMVRYRRR